MSKEKFLLKELEEKIDLFKEDSDDHKRLHRSLRYTTFILTGVLSILSGLAIYYPDQSTTFNIAILALSASAGIIASIEGLRKADQLWIHERTTCYTLTDLKRELEFELIDGKNDDKTVREYFYTFQKILTNSGEKWSSGIVKGPKNSTEDSDTLSPE